MYTTMVDGRLQVTAAHSLLENSRLVKWDHTNAKFQPVTREAFETAWRQDIDPVFGRLICWIMFSAGAEYLAKGTCLVNDIDFRMPKKLSSHPTGDLQKWLSNFRETGKLMRTMPATNFGTIGGLIGSPLGHNTAPLSLLCSKIKATAEQRNLIFASYELLRDTIRNRDAHAYIPNVRDYHNSLVPELFSDCFNLLISWLPGGSVTLNTWVQEATAFIASL